MASSSAATTATTTATTTKKGTYRVGVLLFEGADILDYAGPIETLGNADYNSDFTNNPNPVMSIETIARSNSNHDAVLSTGNGNLFVKPTKTIAETLVVEELATYDVLVVPGGAPDVIQRVGQSEDQLEIKLIQSFVKLKSERERYLMSVCTGSLLLAGAGVLKGLRATTHHMAFGILEGMGQGDGGDQDKIEVVKGQRVVDAGVRDGVRILTAGGVSSGLDSSLYLIGLIAGKEVADYGARMMEHRRRDN